MFISPISQVNNRSVYNNTFVKRANKVDSTVAKDSVSFKASAPDSLIRKFEKVYVDCFDRVHEDIFDVNQKFRDLRWVTKEFPESDKKRYFDVIFAEINPLDIVRRVGNSGTPYFEEIANACRGKALPILVHNGQVLASIVNHGTYGSDNGGNWFSVGNLDKEDFQIIFHRPKTPSISDGYANIAYQAFSRDVDNDLVYTKAPYGEYTFYEDTHRIKKRVEGNGTQYFDKQGRNITESPVRGIKKWLGF